MLLLNGADVEAKSSLYGGTPLVIASIIGNAAVLTMLLDDTADTLSN